MYRNAYQRGLLTVLFSSGSNPLHIWETHTEQDGYIKRFLDNDIKNMVLEIRARNVSTTYITSPKGGQVLGIHLPFLVMVVKNLDKYFTFEITILDETLTKRRFRVANFQSTTQILPMSTVMPICLSKGWNQIQFNLAEFCRKAYNKNFAEVLKVKINANIRIRRIYFAESLPSEEELPAEYKLFFPLQTKKKKIAAAPSTTTEKGSGKKDASKAAAAAAPGGEATTPAEDAKKEQPATETTAKAPTGDGTKDAAGLENAEGAATPVTEPLSEGDTGAESEKAAESEVGTEPATDKSAEPAAELAAEPATELAAEPAAEPAAEVAPA